jgi:hypothetical protein
LGYGTEPRLPPGSVAPLLPKVKGPLGKWGERMSSANDGGETVMVWVRGVSGGRMNVLRHGGARWIAGNRDRGAESES